MPWYLQSDEHMIQRCLSIPDKQRRGIGSERLESVLSQEEAAHSAKGAQSCCPIQTQLANTSQTCIAARPLNFSHVLNIAWPLCRPSPHRSEICSYHPSLHYHIKSCYISSTSYRKKVQLDDLPNVLNPRSEFQQKPLM